MATRKLDLERQATRNLVDAIAAVTKRGYQPVAIRYDDYSPHLGVNFTARKNDSLFHVNVVRDGLEITLTVKKLIRPSIIKRPKPTPVETAT